MPGGEAQIKTIQDAANYNLERYRQFLPWTPRNSDVIVTLAIARTTRHALLRYCVTLRLASIEERPLRVWSFRGAK